MIQAELKRNRSGIRKKEQQLIISLRISGFAPIGFRLLPLSSA